MSIVSESPAADVRHRQLGVTEVLTELLERDLPFASWTIHDSDTNPQLSGMIFRGMGPDADHVETAAIEEWAVFLSAPVQSAPYGPSNEWGRLLLEATYEGVHLELWCDVDNPTDVDPEPAAVLERIRAEAELRSAAAAAERIPA